jgi:predicted transcriptional regulator
MSRQRQRLAGGELEALILDILWDAEGWLTPAQVTEQLRSRHPLAYTSVMTILVRLCAKGLAERQPYGRGFAYRPTSSREELVAERMQELLSTSGDRSAALAHFLDGMGTADRRRLRSLLDATRRRQR